MPVIGTARGVWEAGHAACDAWNEGHYGEVAWHAGTAVLQVTSLKADVKLGLAKGKKVKITRRNKAFPKPVKNAYKLAKEGGKQSGFYKNYIKRSTRELEKSMKSYKKQLARHQDKLAHPPC